VLGLLAAGPAGAVSFPLNVEFDGPLLGSFGNVEVTEVAGDLQFEITLNTATLGGGADLHELYFNLVGPETGLAISTDDDPTTDYALLFAPSPAGGAGSSFGFGVDFGSGAGGPGNGVLQTASFVLSADGALTIADLLLPSGLAPGKGIEVYLAAHIQGTSLVGGVDSETVGNLVPEPSTMGLLALGLFGLSVAGRRPR
jgi:hypothetical protein